MPSSAISPSPTDEHVEQDFLRVVVVEANVLGDGRAPLAVSLDSVHHATAVGALMAGQAILADVDAMVLGGEVEAFAELELRERVLRLMREP